MKVGLIALSGVRVQNAELAALGLTLPGFVRRGRVVAELPSLGLLTLAAVTPEEHEIRYLEIPDARSLPVRGPSAPTGGVVLPEFDLVGISSLTAQIDEAYAVADVYRARGTKVVLGGLHVSALPEEALEHADAVVVGEAEGAWPTLIRDAVEGRLGRRYRSAPSDFLHPASPIVPRFDLLAGGAYNRVTVQTTRGCPRDCEFCAASLRISDRYRQKPVPQVVDEIRAARAVTGLDSFEFADDNSFLDRARSIELLRALAAEGIRWFTETDVSVADDTRLCDALAASGCRQVLIGFESPRAGDLTGVDPAHWKQEKVPGYLRAIDRLQSRGVSVNGCFVLGLDGHTPEVFPQVLEFVRSSGLAEAQYTVLTPFPGTPLYHRLWRERRLLRERFWDQCTLFDVTFRPAGMTVEELESGLRWLMRETYSRDETRRRIRGFLNQRRSGLGPHTARDPGPS